MSVFQGWTAYHPTWTMGWFPLFLEFSSPSALTFLSKCQPVESDNKSHKAAEANVFFNVLSGSASYN